MSKYSDKVKRRAQEAARLAREEKAKPLKKDEPTTVAIIAGLRIITQSLKRCKHRIEKCGKLYGELSSREKTSDEIEQVRQACYYLQVHVRSERRVLEMYLKNQFATSVANGESNDRVLLEPPDSVRA